MIQQIWLANGLLFVHMIVVGFTVAGGVAIFTGRFKKFHKKERIWATNQDILRQKF